MTAALKRAYREGYFPRDGEAVLGSLLLQRPLALLYDLDAWEDGLRACRDSFGPHCLHALAMKSNPVTSLLKRAVNLGFGLECASIGEVLHARALGCPAEKIVFDSPCKTRSDLDYALRQGIHVNVDNFEELRRTADLVKGLPESAPTPSVGFRINPMSGAGTISALSVSVADSKFGVSVTLEAELLEAFKENEWLNCVHVHVGSGNMGTQMLVHGVRTAVEFARRVNEHTGRKQVTTLDIGGGLAVDYASEALPSHVDYAESLRREIPGLLRAVEADDNSSQCPPLFDRVITEFGQSLNAKAGWLASRVEYMKSTADNAAQIAVIHFGADVCPRQCYTKDHKRRLEFYDAAQCSPLKSGLRAASDGSSPAVAAVASPAHLAPSGLTRTHVAGPLCFQGDFIAKDTEAPPLRVDDFVVMREAGSNCLSLFSRHCSRFAPAVLGYRLGSGTDNDGHVELAEFEVLKPAECLDSLVGFWGLSEVPAEVTQEISGN